MNMKKLRKVLCLVAAMMVAVLSVSAAEWEKPIPKNCSLESGQSYYLYNVTANRFVVTDGGLLPTMLFTTSWVFVSTQLIFVESISRMARKLSSKAL